MDADQHPSHAVVASRVAESLAAWAGGEAGRGATVYAGDVSIRLPLTAPLRVDVVCLAPHTPAVVLVNEGATTTDGVPVLVVVVERPRHTFGELGDAVRQLRKAGVPLVWMIDPHFETVTVHYSHAEPVMLTGRNELDGSDALSGFRVPVARLFPG